MSMEGVAVGIRLVRVIIRNTGVIELAGKLVLIQRTGHPSAIGSGWDFGGWLGRLARLRPSNRG